MQTIILVRHAESEINTNPDIIGGRSNDVGLSKLGVKQAHALGEHWKDIGFQIPKAIFVSPAQRTQMTAEIALSILGIPKYNFIIDDLIQEISQGKWEGKKRSTIYTPKRQEEVKNMKGHFKAPGGESQIDVQNRMYERLLEITDRTGKDILIFSHGFSIRALVQRIVGDFQPGNLHDSPDLKNTGITIIKHDGNGTFSVPVFNDLSHLEGNSIPNS